LLSLFSLSPYTFLPEKLSIKKKMEHCDISTYVYAVVGEKVAIISKAGSGCGMWVKVRGARAKLRRGWAGRGM
jgi:hypothetical protein